MYFLAGTFRGRPCYRNASGWWLLQRIDGALQIGRYPATAVYETPGPREYPGNPWQTVATEPGSTAPPPVVEHSDRCALDAPVAGGRRARLEWGGRSEPVRVQVAIRRSDDAALRVRDAPLGICDAAVLIDGVARHVQTALDPKADVVSFDCRLTADEIAGVARGSHTIGVGINGSWAPMGLEALFAPGGK